MIDAHWSLTVVTAPTVEPLSLADARLHLKLDSDQTVEDDLIESLITAAREQCEQETGRAFVQRTYDLRIDTSDPAFDAALTPILLPVSPVQSVDGVYYVDADGTEQTLDAAKWDADVYSEPPRVMRAYGATWPDIRATEAGFRVRFTAGYAPSGSPIDYTANVPARAIAAMRLLVGHLYAHREAVLVGGRAQAIVLPVGVERLLAGLRVAVLAS